MQDELQPREIVIKNQKNIEKSIRSIDVQLRVQYLTARHVANDFTDCLMKKTEDNKEEGKEI